MPPKSRDLAGSDQGGLCWQACMGLGSAPGFHVEAGKETLIGHHLEILPVLQALI